MVQRAKIATLVLAGIETIHDLAAAHRAGAGVVRVATRAEADVSAHHIAAAVMSMDTINSLMMSHMTTAAAGRTADLMKDVARGTCMSWTTGGAIDHARHLRRPVRRRCVEPCTAQLRNRHSHAVTCRSASPIPIAAVEHGAHRVDASLTRNATTSGPRRPGSASPWATPACAQAFLRHAETTADRFGVDAELFWKRPDAGV